MCCVQTPLLSLKPGLSSPARVLTQDRTLPASHRKIVFEINTISISSQMYDGLKGEWMSWFGLGAWHDSLDVQHDHGISLVGRILGAIFSYVMCSMLLLSLGLWGNGDVSSLILLVHCHVLLCSVHAGRLPQPNRLQSRLPSTSFSLYLQWMDGKLANSECMYENKNART